MRKLASIQKITAIDPIPDADAIDKGRVLGWDVVIKKGEFQVDSKCVFFEIDSILPEKDWSEFLRSKKFRIKTVRMRGVLSQGLALPLSILPEGNYEIDDDVTELLGVVKYEPPPPKEAGAMLGNSAGSFPYGVPKTDETRIQSCLEVLDELKGKPYYISVKCDGTSSTFIYEDNEFKLCSRNWAKKDDGVNLYSFVCQKYGLRDKLMNHPGIAIQGECVGPGMQKNRLKLPEFELFVFNVWDNVNRKYFDFVDFVKFCKDLNLQTVPIEEVGDSFSYTLEQLLSKAEGKYVGTDNDREGIVVRPQQEMHSRALKGRLSFKAVNNTYLLKGGV